MSTNKLIMQSLPMVASALGRKYGVRVEIGGKQACTDGKTIYLPRLPLDCDETLTSLARGYIDHESAHIRETRFDLLQKAKLSPLEKHVMNVFEDWRVENRLARIFPGCRQNFNWLIRHLFDRDGPLPDPPEAILDWLLLTVRAWDVPAIAKRQSTVQGVINRAYPDLPKRLIPVLLNVKNDCRSTQSAIDFAREVVVIIKAMLPDVTQRERKPLERLIHADADSLPKGMGEVLAETLDDASPSENSDALQVARIGAKTLKSIPAEDLMATRRASRALRTRLHGLLQAKVTRNVRLGRQGRLDARELHRLAVNDGRVFRRRDEVSGINTAVHLLVDCSGSMRRRIKLTSQVCHTLATALDVIPGINVGVTAFPAGTPATGGNSNPTGPTVFPVLEHGKRMHGRFQLIASGQTPLGEALWWVLQRMQPMPQSRKVILILTDGEPDSMGLANAAIADAKRFGFEVLGLGLDSDAIAKLLPGSSRTITTLADLAPAMFGQLQSALLKS